MSLGDDQIDSIVVKNLTSLLWLTLISSLLLGFGCFLILGTYKIEVKPVIFSMRYRD